MVPPLSGFVIDRPILMQAVRDALIAPNSGVVAITTALEGAGGFGKTTVAAHVCLADPLVKERFPGGLLWVTVGQHLGGAELASKINSLCELMTGLPATVSDPELAGARLGALLDQRQDTILVIDDIWNSPQLRPFLMGGHRCRRLVTTRNGKILPRRSQSVLVDAMEHDEATLTLTYGAITMPPETANRLLALTGRWPLLLALVNAAVLEQQRQGATAEEASTWVINRLMVGGPTALDLDLDLDLDDTNSRETAVAASLQASLDLLSPSERDRYFDLGVFPEDTDIPVEVLALFWAATGEMGRDATDRLRDKLVALRACYWIVATGHASAATSRRFPQLLATSPRNRRIGRSEPPLLGCRATIG